MKPLLPNLNAERLTNDYSILLEGGFVGEKKGEAAQAAVEHPEEDDRHHNERYQTEGRHDATDFRTGESIDHGIDADDEDDLQAVDEQQFQETREDG